MRGVRNAPRFMRFIAVGVLNTLFGYGVFSAAILVGANPFVALVIAYAVGVVFNFFTTGRLVFRERRASIVKFVFAYVLIYLFNAALYWLLATTGANPLLVQALCIPVVTVFSYTLFNTFVFKE